MESTQGVSATVTAAAPTAPVTETPKETAPVVETTKDPDFSSRFAALTRKERAIMQREKEIKAMRNDPTWKEYENFKALKADPRRNAMKVVESLGVPLSDFYQDLTGLVLNDGKPSVEQELSMIKDQMARRSQQEQEQAQRQRQAVDTQNVNRFASDIVKETEKNPDAYELTRTFSSEGSIQLGLQVAEEYFNKTKKLPTPKQIADAVEKYYEEQTGRLKTIKKLGYVAPEQTPPSDKQAAEIQKKIQPVVTKTLTNHAASLASNQVQVEDRSLMNPERRRAWTAAKLKAEWNKK